MDSAALQVHRPSGRPVRAHDNKRQRPFCDNCNRYGHTKATCYQIHGYPSKSVQAPNSFGRPSSSLALPSVAAILTHPAPASTATANTGTPIFTQDQYNRIIALIDPPSLDDVNSSMINLTGNQHSTEPPWYIDSGATHHICCQFNLFTSYHKVKHHIHV